MEKEVAKFGKNAAEEVIVHLKDYKHQDLVDIRVFLRPLMGEENQEPKATQKGICLRVEQIPNLLDALKKAEQAYEELKESRRAEYSKNK